MKIVWRNPYSHQNLSEVNNSRADSTAQIPSSLFQGWISLFESLQNNGSHHCCHFISQLTCNVSFYHLYYNPLLVIQAYSSLILLIGGLTRHRIIQRYSNISVTARGKSDFEKSIHTKLLLLLGNESYVTLNLKLLLLMLDIKYSCIQFVKPFLYILFKYVAFIHTIIRD